MTGLRQGLRTLARAMMDWMDSMAGVSRWINWMNMVSLGCECVYSVNWEVWTVGSGLRRTGKAKMGGVFTYLSGFRDNGLRPLLRRKRDCVRQGDH